MTASLALSQADLYPAISYSGREWRLRDFSAPLFGSLSQLEGLSPAQAELLARRGVSAELAPSFLEPRLRDSLVHPDKIQDLPQAADRLAHALANREQIALLADSDADGSSAAAVMIRYLRHFDCEPQVITPDRLSEGYGPRVEHIRQLREQGCGLLITLDCGTTATEALSEAASLGLDVIVCDHHTAEAGLPPAVAVVNPNRFDDTSGEGGLAGVGVAFMLVVATNARLRQTGQASDVPDPLAWTDLVALGTVCDVRPLQGSNRALVFHGLHRLARQAQGGGNKGLVALLEVLGIDKKPTAETFAFQLGPCINAGARLGYPELARSLLSTDDRREALSLAGKLVALNQQRREIEERVRSQALQQALQQAEAVGKDLPLVLVSGENWHRGVLGIVAGRLRERFHCPVIVLSRSRDESGAEVLNGSGRSPEGIDLGTAILAARQVGLLTAGGGHPAAAGLSLKAEHLDELKAFLTTRLQQEAQQMADSPSRLTLDGVLRPSEVTLQRMKAIETLAPFGAGNPKPLFAIGGLRIVSQRSIARDTGLALRLRSEDSGLRGSELRGVCFRVYDTGLGQLLRGADTPSFAVAAHLALSDFGGFSGKVPELLVRDVAPIGALAHLPSTGYVPIV